MARKKKPKTISEQLKAAIQGSGLTHYRIAKDAGMGPAILDRFVSGERTITLATADKIADVLKLELRPKK